MDLSPPYESFRLQPWKKIVRESFAMQMSILQIFEETYCSRLFNIRIALDVPAFDNIKDRVKSMRITGFQILNQMSGKL